MAAVFFNLAPATEAALILGLDARDIAQGDGTAVSDWTSGFGSASQATANWQPLFRTASVPLGGRPGVQFDSQPDANAVAEADGMVTTATGVGEDYSVLSLYAYRGDVGFARVVQGGNGTRHAAGDAGENNWLIGPYGGPGQGGTHRLYDGSFIDSGNGTTSPVIATALGRSVGDEDFYLNGALVASNAGTTTPGSIGLGAEGAFAESAKSDIGLVLVFDTTLTDDERVGVEYYMAQAYGLDGFDATMAQQAAGRVQLGTFLENLPVAPTDIALTPGSFLSSLPSGGIAGTLSTFDPNGQDTHTYALVAGDGATDNERFELDGNQLKTTTSFAADGGGLFSIRVRSTDNGGLSFEKAIAVEALEDSDADMLPDAWELMFTSDLGDLTGLAHGPGPGPGTGDFDDDGSSDTEEWENGTDPLTFPQSGATLLLGLDARDIAQGDGTAVSDWTSGFGSASQATANWQPLFRTASVPLGGRPGVQFDSQPDVDAVAEADGMVTTTTGVGEDYSVLSLYAYRGDVGYARVVQGGNGTRHAAGDAVENNWLIGPYGVPDQGGTHRLYDGSFIDSGNGTTSPVIATALGRSVGDEDFYLNGALVASNAGTTTPGTIGLGAEGTFAESAKSDIGLVLVFDTTLTDDERVGVEYYMAQAYGLDGFAATGGEQTAAAAVLGDFLTTGPRTGSRFEIITFEHTAGATEATVIWNSIPGTVYSVDYSDSLRSNQWFNVDDFVRASDGETTSLTHIFVPAEPVPKRFYRVTIP